MVIKTPKDPKFKRIYTKHCKLLKLKGLQPKTIDAYSRAIRRIGQHFDYELNDLLEAGVDLLDCRKSWGMSVS